MSDRILVTFEGGPKHGEQTWWRGGSYIEAVEMAPTPRILSAFPDRTALKRHLYRIDDAPQPNGTYIARLA